MMQKPLSSYSFTTRLYDIDAAGIMFYARSFYYLHDAYEEMLQEHNLQIDDILRSQYLFPIAHAEADFKFPIKLNQFINIEIYPGDITPKGFTLKFEFKNNQGKTVISALSRHVCVDRQSHRTADLPVEWVNILTGKQ